MREALRIASFARGRTSPNPLVGAVIVREGRIIAEGWHRKAGTQHAEIHALAMAGDLAKGATLYVTLEPCSHFGRTGPCAEAIVKSGIQRVVVAMEDPNPKVSGRGCQILRDHGIEVTLGVLERDARALNEVFLHWITTGRPFVTLKTAMSLDGKIATSSGESKWITGEKARSYVHQLRDASDAILVGIGTVLADDPSLTTRLAEGNGKNPKRIILDSMARIPLDSKVLTDEQAETIIAVTSRAPKDRVNSLCNTGATILMAGDGEVADLPILLSELGKREITSLFVEGGSRVNDAFLRAGLIDKVYAFIAPLLLGGESAPTPVGGKGVQKLSDALVLDRMSVQSLGQDVLLEAYPRIAQENP